MSYVPLLLTIIVPNFNECESLFWLVVADELERTDVEGQPKYTKKVDQWQT